MIDIRQTPKYAKYLRKTGWIVEDVNHTCCFVKKLPVLGAIIKVQRPETIPFKKIEGLAKKYHAFQTIIEPKRDFDAKFLIASGLKLSKNPYLPTKTLQLDLTKTQNELFSQLKKDAKQAIRKSEELEIINCKLEDIEKFREGWKRAVGWKRYVSPLLHLKALKETFGKDALFLKTKDNSSGAIFLLEDKIAYYWQAFTAKSGRKTLAQYKIVWEGILWAKKRGAKIFDFEGTYDNRFPHKSWAGFSHFKKSFGGYEVEYPGAFVKGNINIKGLFIIGVVLFLLALNWAALDDITTGHEPNYWMEYDILLFSIIIFGIIIYTKFIDIKQLKRKRSKK